MAVSLGDLPFYKKNIIEDQCMFTKKTAWEKGGGVDSVNAHLVKS